MLPIRSKKAEAMEQGIKADRRIGDNIRSLRNDRGMTQERLAARLQVNGCDMTRGTVAKIEAGIRHVSLDELKCIREILNCGFDDLLK